MTEEMMNKKIEYWKHRLLDLGKRNRMINYRRTKRSTLFLTEPSFGELYRRIALNEATLSFRRPIDRNTDPRVFSMLTLMKELGEPLTVTVGDIGYDVEADEARLALQNMRSRAMLALEEQGSNILYLSFGFLEWREKKSENAPILHSPLLMVPVTLSAASLHAPFTLKKRDEDIVVNPTLAHYFESEFGIKLPEFDENAENAEKYMEKCEVFAEACGFRVLREVSLGLLSFLKISMYKDMEQNEARIRKSPVIRAMAGETKDFTFAPHEEGPVEDDPFTTYQVLSADSSQKEAIRAAKQGLSFVMQGPPGTGKSQTITNMIAESLAQGKKVLFVSEKMAALRVVYRRLEETGLADFCLPLHSYKANKRQILQEIGANLKLKPIRVKEEALQELSTLSLERDKLNAYVAELHQPILPLGKTPYEIFGALIALEDVPSLRYTEKDPLSLDAKALHRREATLMRYGESLSTIGMPIKDNPWHGLVEGKSGYSLSLALHRELTSLEKALDELKSALSPLRQYEKATEPITIESYPAFASMLRVYFTMPPLPRLWQEDKEALARALSLAEELKATEESLTEAQKACDAVFYPEAAGTDPGGFYQSVLALSGDLLRLGLIDCGDAKEYEEKRQFLLKNKDLILDSVQNYKKGVTDFIRYRDEISALLGIPLSGRADAIDEVETLLPLLRENGRLSITWTKDALPTLKALCQKAKAVAEAFKEGEDRIRAYWQEDVFALDADGLYLSFANVQNSMRRIFNAQYARNYKLISSYYKGEVPPTKEDVLQLLKALRALKEMHSFFEVNAKELVALGPSYRGIDTDFSLVERDLSFAKDFFITYHGELTHSLLTHFTQEDRRVLLGAVMVALYHMRQANEAMLAAKGSCFAEPIGKSGNLEYLFDLLTQAETILKKQAEAEERLMALVKDPTLSSEELGAACRRFSEKERLAVLFEKRKASAKLVFGTLYNEEENGSDSLILFLKQAQKMRFASKTNQRSEEKERCLAALRKGGEAYALVNKGIAFLNTCFTGEGFEKMTPEALADRTKALLATLDRLELYAEYTLARAACLDEGLGDFLEAYEASSASDTAGENVAEVYRKSFYEAFRDACKSNLPALRRFDKKTHEESVKRFAALDKKQLSTAGKRLREKLIAALPPPNRALRAGDEVTILQRELQKRRGIMPLRKLFKTIPHLLMRLKPCLMMSPLSVSYFLEAKNYHFDLVIFDEASQIFPEDAIGAICRGSQVVIVGDSMQLPPTNFFSAHATGDDTYNEDEDDDEALSESILEKTAACLPTRTLLWHYRSRHEHLIAFSNREIYHSSLITFPSAEENTPDCGIEYVYVPDGRYEGGGKNCNQKEAEQCVTLTEEHILRHPERSLGIIAFSEKQQRAIEEAITAFRESHPEYEPFFAENKEEPFFVKNLENVQGDERDTVFFSIGYAKDKNNRMYMRFGPLGKEGGERRLNVAITRAKENIKLIGSILPADIDLSRTSSEGVRMLRAYIDFAIHGESALEKKESRCESEEDLFADSVAAFLSENGYPVRRQVGCSEYKLDIAVLHPSRPGEILAGIECDGATYAASGNARDRDSLRKTVLTGMGWRLFRAWSSAWVSDPKKEKKALLAFLEKCLAGEGDASLVALPMRRIPMESTNHLPFDAADGAENGAESTQNTEASEASHGQYDENVDHTLTNALVNEQNPYGFSYYHEADWSRAPHSGSKDRDRIIAERLYFVISREGPIHKELLYKRMASSFRAGKVTEGVRLAVDGVLNGTLATHTVTDDREFVSLTDAAPVKARIPREGDTPRSMEFIAREEVADAMLTLLAGAVGITAEELFSETARVFGAQRMGPKIRAKLEEALFYLMMRERLRLNDGKVTLII